MKVDAGTYATTTAQIIDWASRSESKYVCVANVHMVMETRASDSFRLAVNAADLVTSDGMPLVWILRCRGFRAAQRVYGPDLMLHLCAAAESAALPVGLLGATANVLDQLSARLLQRFPNLKIAAIIAPPFGNLSPAQNAEYSRQLSTAKIIFVGLGCPKQERWMAEVSPQIPAVLIGVGAAFDIHAGLLRQAPPWLQRLGLEWAFRLAMEPRRLWRRYLWHNPRFMLAMICEEVGRRYSGKKEISELNGH